MHYYFIFILPHLVAMSPPLSPSTHYSKAVKYFCNIRNTFVHHHHHHPSSAMMHHKVWKKVIMIHIMGQWEIRETSPENVEWNFINLKKTRHQNFKSIRIKSSVCWCKKAPMINTCNLCGCIPCSECVWAVSDIYCLRLPRLGDLRPALPFIVARETKSQCDLQDRETKSQCDLQDQQVKSFLCLTPCLSSLSWGPARLFKSIGNEKWNLIFPNRRTHTVNYLISL